MQEHLQEFVTDFLNLIFGVGQETEFFWGSILFNQVVYDYDYCISKEIRSTSFR